MDFDSHLDGDVMESFALHVCAWLEFLEEVIIFLLSLTFPDFWRRFQDSKNKQTCDLKC